MTSKYQNWYQVKEIKVKMILYNLAKVIQTFVIVIIVEAFQQSPKYHKQFILGRR